LLAPAGGPTGERGVVSPAAPEEVATQAERLGALSADLTQSAAALVTDADPKVRVDAAAKLLAKSIVDLQVSAYLFDAHEDELAGGAASRERRGERSSAGLGATQEYLDILLGREDGHSVTREGGEPIPPDLATARVELSDSITDALARISERASKTGQDALSGTLGLSLAELAHATAFLGMDIAQALGVGAQVTRLYQLFRSFVINSYQSVLAVFGQQLAQTAAREALEWFKEFREGKHFQELLEKAYQTQKTRQELTPLVSKSQAELGSFVVAIRGVEDLSKSYGRQADLAGKLNKALKYIALVPVATLPNGQLVLAAFYLLIGSYAVIAGADFVSAPHLRLFGRFPGVRETVDHNLREAQTRAQTL
jgi:hypothetical protein